MSDTGDEEQLTAVEGPGRPVDVVDAPLASDEERFEPVGLLGKGGMGEVRLYRDRRISRFVAYKVLKKSVEKDQHFRSRFLLEARVQGQLEHPAIVPVHDLGETADGELFFSMKSVRGLTLKQALDSIRRGTPTRTGVTQYSRRRLLTAFSSVCLAVDFAHSRGVVHRDLKPENVMLGEFGEVYVLDWGIAKVMHHSETPLGEVIDVPQATTTRAGATLGTPKYMAPERQHGVATPQTDVYALGMILADILSVAPDDVPPELDAIKRSATATNTIERYPTARALHDELERYLDGDRGLETRRKLAEDHARRAEEALARAQHDPEARAQAGGEIGRALGLDPDNRVALRMLTRMLTDVPQALPAAAQADMHERWLQRTARMNRLSTISTMSMLGLVPLILWMGVRDWSLLGAFIALVVIAGVVQFTGARTRWAYGVALLTLLSAVSVLTTSFGLFGVVPAAFAIVTMAWRMNVQKTIHGILILIASAGLVVAPFVLVELSVIAPNVVLRDGAIMLLPRMHAFPPGPTLTAALLGTIGAVGVAIFYGRLYINELRRAEHRLSFQAWQLQQLIPPER
jgi:eukaryotic-like serine/threonine-protein kinase